jgi:hypothetical protein
MEKSSSAENIYSKPQVTVYGDVCDITAATGGPNQVYDGSYNAVTGVVTWDVQGSVALYG